MDLTVFTKRSSWCAREFERFPGLGVAMNLVRIVLSLVVLGALDGPCWAQTNLRAWSEHGQSFLVWEDDLGLGAVIDSTDTYEVYRSDVPIVDTSSATRIGRLFARDWSAARLQLSAGPAATHRIPDGAGGTYALAPTEVVFAYTNRSATPDYFAVVHTGTTTPPVGGTAGPVAPSSAEVIPHLQYSGVDGGHPFDVFAFWIDGNADASSGSSAFPVMGNASFNGTVRLFAVFEPQLGLPPAPRPAVLFLHGSGGSYWKFRPSEGPNRGMDLNVEDGLYVTLDDNQNVYSDFDPGMPVVEELMSRWFGYCESYDRFSSLYVVPPGTARIVDYTQRQIGFVLRWLLGTHGVDRHRVAMAGLSGGARGVMNYVRVRPDQIAAATCFVPGYEPVTTLPAVLGTAAQDLATNLPGRVGIQTFLDPRTRVAPGDLPFVRMIWGTNDVVVQWDCIPEIIRDLDDQRRGSHFYWDQRGHTNLGGPWTGAYFAGSPRHDPPWLTRYRNDRSFPAFFDVDHDPAQPGIQPFPEDPPVDAFGTWGGWIDWRTDTIVDTPRHWSCELSLVSGSPFPPDNAPLSTAIASVVVRRPQALLLAPFQPFAWVLRDVATGAAVQSGIGRADPDGRAQVSSLVLGTSLSRLEITRLRLIRFVDGLIPGVVRW
jgi:poly(3-hydroxybutyrate) depolymerase